MKITAAFWVGLRDLWWRNTTGACDVRPLDDADAARVRYDRGAVDFTAQALHTFARTLTAHTADERRRLACEAVAADFRALACRSRATGDEHGAARHDAAAEAWEVCACQAQASMEGARA